MLIPWANSGSTRSSAFLLVGMIMAACPETTENTAAATQEAAILQSLFLYDFTIF
jgi:hypothetical protein